MKYCFMDKNAQSHYRQKQTCTHTRSHITFLVRPLHGCVFHGADSRSLQLRRYLCNSLLLEKTVLPRSPSLPPVLTLFLPFSLSRQPSLAPPRSHRSVLTFSCDKAILYSAIFVQPDKISRTEIHQREMVFILIHFWGRNKRRGGEEGLRSSKRKTEKKRTTH